MEKGQDLLRTKGILHFRGKDQRFAFQAVHMLADGDFIGPWNEDAPRQSRIVFIGRNVAAPNCSAVSRLASPVERRTDAL